MTMKPWRRALDGDIKDENGLYVCRAKSGSIADLIVEAVNSFILKPDAALAQKAALLDEAIDILDAILASDERGQGVNFSTAMDRACKFVYCVKNLPSTPPAICERDEVIDECANKLSDWAKTRREQAESWRVHFGQEHAIEKAKVEAEHYEYAEKLICALKSSPEKDKA